MKKNITSPKGILFDMDGVLLVPTQSADQSWQQVCQQFAPTLGLSPQFLDEALRESRRAYMKDIEHDAQKQRRDRLEPFETRREAAERGLEKIGRGDTSLPDRKSVREKTEDQHKAMEKRNPSLVR
jgi:beta-phosphoglucomutase-like phosphatase (HAD superfamily)